MESTVSSIRNMKIEVLDSTHDDYQWVKIIYNCNNYKDETYPCVVNMFFENKDLPKIFHKVSGEYGRE